MGIPLSPHSSHACPPPKLEGKTRNLLKKYTEFTNLFTNPWINLIREPIKPPPCSCGALSYPPPSPALRSSEPRTNPPSSSRILVARACSLSLRCHDLRLARRASFLTRYYMPVFLSHLVCRATLWISSVPRDSLRCRLCFAALGGEGIRGAVLSVATSFAVLILGFCGDWVVFGDTELHCVWEEGFGIDFLGIVCFLFCCVAEALNRVRRRRKDVEQVRDCEAC